MRPACPQAMSRPTWVQPTRTTTTRPNPIPWLSQRRQRSLCRLRLSQRRHHHGQAVRTVGGFIWNDLNGDGIYNAGTGAGHPRRRCDRELRGGRHLCRHQHGLHLWGQLADLGHGDRTGKLHHHRGHDGSAQHGLFGHGRPGCPPPTAVPGVCVGCDRRTTITVNGGDVLGQNFGYQQQFSSHQRHGLCGWPRRLRAPVRPARQAPIQGVTITLVSAGPDGFLGHRGRDHPVPLPRLGERTIPQSWTLATIRWGDRSAQLYQPGGYGRRQRQRDQPGQPGRGSGHERAQLRGSPSATGTIGDFVWYDTNGNGIQDGGEPGIPGVAISLTNSVGSVVTTTTNAAGIYTFTNLMTGAYTVTVGSGTPVSATATSGAGSQSSPYPVSLTTGQVITNADFGYEITPAYTLSKVLITGNPARTREVVQLPHRHHQHGGGRDRLPAPGGHVQRSAAALCLGHHGAGQQRQRRHPQLDGSDRHPGRYRPRPDLSR